MICTFIIAGITLLVMIIASRHGHGNQPVSIPHGAEGIGGSGIGGSGSTVYNNGSSIATADGGNTKCDILCIGVIMGVIGVLVCSFLMAVCTAICMDKRYHHKKQHKKQQQWLNGSSQLGEIAIIETEPNSMVKSDREREPHQHQYQQQHQSQQQSQPEPQSPQSPQSPLSIPTSPHLEPRGGPPSISPFQPCDGRWQGQYHGHLHSLQNFGDHDMHVELQFDASNHSITGTKGHDDRGNFTLTGEYRMHTSRIACVKRYKWSTCTGAARVLYLGTLTNERHIDGTWELPNGDTGTFQLDYVETEPDAYVDKSTACRNPCQGG